MRIGRSRVYGAKHCPHTWFSWYHPLELTLIQIYHLLTMKTFKSRYKMVKMDTLSNLAKFIPKNPPKIGDGLEPVLVDQIA